MHNIGSAVQEMTLTLFPAHCEEVEHRLKQQTKTNNGKANFLPSVWFRGIISEDAILKVFTQRKPIFVK